jgi:hypothetical protein
LVSIISFFAISFIIVVALSVISFKFMQMEKFMRFANIGLFIPFILLSFIKKYYLSLHFIICKVLYFCFLRWIWVLILVHFNFKFNYWYNGVFCYLILKLMWNLSHWMAFILFSTATFHAIGKPYLLPSWFLIQELYKWLTMYFVQFLFFDKKLCMFLKISLMGTTTLF